MNRTEQRLLSLEQQIAEFQGDNGTKELKQSIQFLKLLRAQFDKGDVIQTGNEDESQIYRDRVKLAYIKTLSRVIELLESMEQEHGLNENFKTLIRMINRMHKDNEFSEGETAP
ncbi:MAG TPA: hypothetical protein VN512_12995 [Clostridia bacterium]|nr:hypothetical protein [Clostridia bacterium]